MLVRIARQSRLGDPEGCAAILALLAASRVVRADLDRVLAGLGLNEARLAALVALYAIDPESSTPAELALESQVSRVSMADTIETLHAGGWVRRKRDVRDRRTFRLELTGEGRALVQGAVRPFLATVGRSADLLTAGERLAITRACRRLRAHFQTRSL